MVNQSPTTTHRIRRRAPAGSEIQPDTEESQLLPPLSGHYLDDPGSCADGGHGQDKTAAVISDLYKQRRDNINVLDNNQIKSKLVNKISILKEHDECGASGVQMEGVVTDAGIEAGGEKNRKVVMGDDGVFLVMKPKMMSSGRPSTSHKTEQVEMTNQGLSYLCSDSGGGHRVAQWTVQQDAATQVSFVHKDLPEPLKLVSTAINISTQCPSLWTWKQQSSANCDKTRARTLSQGLKKSPNMKVKAPCYRITVGKMYRKRGDVDENIPTPEHNSFDHTMIHGKTQNQCYNQASCDKTQPGYDKQDKKIIKPGRHLLKESRNAVRKRRNNLMVLGKLKCLQFGNYSKTNKVTKPISRYAHYINKNAVGDGYTEVNKKRALQRGSKGNVPVSSENAATRDRSFSKKQAEIVILNSEKAGNYMSHYDRVEGDVVRENSVANNTGKHIEFCYQQELKRSPRDVSCLGRMLMEEPHNTRERFLYRAAGKQYRPHRSLKYVVKRGSQFHRPTHRHFYRFSRSELLPSYSLNFNSNAGIFELGPDASKSLGGKQSSCTSVHSTDQYYSIHTDTPDAKVVDSDLEVSPSFSLTEEIVDKHSGNVSEPNAIAGSGQHKNFVSECEGRRENESSRHKKTHETACAEDSDGDTQIASAENSNHKKKTKTTEALYIKFESSMSKKVTTTTVLKDGRRPSVNKFRADSHKQLSLPVDSQKSVLGPMDNKSTADNPRYTKIVRYSDHFDNSETKLKQSCVIDPVTGNESQSSRSAHSHEAEPVSPDQRRSRGKSRSTSRTRCEVSSHSRHVSPEKITLQVSPNKPLSGSCPRDHKHDTSEDGFTLERESSAATIVNTVPSSPVRHGLLREHSAKSEPGRQKIQDPPRRESSNSQEKKEHTKQTAATNRKASNSRAEHRPRAEARSASKTRSPRPVKSPQTETNSAKRSLSRVKRSGISPEDRVSRSDSKKLPGARRKTKSSDDLSSKDHASELSKSHLSISDRKRSQNRMKTLPRSPDTKRKRRTMKKDSDGEDFKQDKYKKQKMNEKMLKKKKKQKQQKQVSSEDEDSIERQRPPKKRIQPLKSRSGELNKNIQSLSTSLSAPHLDEIRSDFQISPPDYCLNRSKEESRATAIKERQSIGDDLLLSLDREYTSQGREVRIRSCAFSAENVSIAPSGSKSMRCAESVPTFTGTVYKAMTKVVQVAACSKSKRTEKDLQRAESGWNSSTMSPEEKAAAEKTKQNKKAAKMRYYIVKPRSGKGNKESVIARSRCAAQKEGDVLGSADEADDKLKLGQGKSVQFSDNIEDLEALKNDVGHDKGQEHVPVGNNIEISPLSSLAALQPPNKTADGEQLTANKPGPPKKEEAHQPTTPPRRRRPVWMKKSNKSKTSAKTTASTKSSSALVPFKQRQGSEDTIKPGSRFNVHLYYPVKKAIESPMLSNISLSDKRIVAYNSWINNVFLAAPMNKATRKLVAQTGSPVDIKEIIEGSSVDAADHFRPMKVLQDSGVRAATSAPYLGPQRGGNMEVSGNKRLKQNDEPRSSSVKRAKAAKAQETGPARSISPHENTGDQGAFKNSELGDDNSTAKHSNESDNVPGQAQKIGYSKLIGPGHQRKKDKKQGKKLSGNLPVKWPRGVRSNREIASLPNLPHGHYYGDTADINVLNVGLNWMVQRVFRSLPFLHLRKAQASANASGDASLNQQVVQ